MNEHSDTDNIQETEIGRLRDAAQAEVCARMMASAEPWTILQRDFDASLAIVTDPSREVYVATVEGEIAGFIVLLMHGAFVGYIQSVCVAPERRGQGIGTQLMAFAERRIFGSLPVTCW
jgi:ribosomal protein S18 acetylase RimI-like enzyme